MGLFLDYGLNDIKPDASRERLIDYNAQNPTDFTREYVGCARSHKKGNAPDPGQGS